MAPFPSGITAVRNYFYKMIQILNAKISKKLFGDFIFIEYNFYHFNTCTQHFDCMVCLIYSELLCNFVLMYAITPAGCL